MMWLIGIGAGFSAAPPSVAMQSQPIDTRASFKFMERSQFAVAVHDSQSVVQGASISACTSRSTRHCHSNPAKMPMVQCSGPLVILDYELSAGTRDQPPTVNCEL